MSLTKKTVTGRNCLYLDKVFDFEGELDLGFDLELDTTRMEVAKAIEKSFPAKKLSVITTLIFLCMRIQKNWPRKKAVPIICILYGYYERKKSG